jgi:hypothetical protein
MSEAALGLRKRRRIFSVKVRRNVKLDAKNRHHPCRVNSLNRFADPVYCIVRLIVGLTYACHGGQKLFGFPGGGHGMSGLAFVAGIIELVCGFLIAFGLFTRIAAFPDHEWRRTRPVVLLGFLFHYLLRSGTLEYRCAMVQRQKQRAVHLIQTSVVS